MGNSPLEDTGLPTIISSTGLAGLILNMERVLDPGCQVIQYIGTAVSTGILTFTVRRIFLATLVWIEPWENKPSGPIGTNGTMVEIAWAPRPPVLVTVIPLWKK